MRLGELIDDPRLDLHPVHVDARARDREIRSVYTTDLVDPSRYLARDRLVLTGMVWRVDRATDDAFVAHLAAAGVCALGAGEGVIGHVPDDLVDACLAHDLPLFAVPPDVAFTDVTERIEAHAIGARVHRLSERLTRQRQLITDVAAGRALTDIAAVLTAETGLDCRLFSPTGRDLLERNDPLPDHVIDTVVTAALAAAGRAVTTTGPDGHRRGAVTVGPPDQPTLSSWVLVLDGGPEAWGPRLDDTRTELAAIATIDRARRDGVTGPPVDADELTDPVSGAVLLRRAGLVRSGDDRVRALHVVADGPGEAQALLARLVTDAATDLDGPGTPLIGLAGPGSVVAVVPAAAGTDGGQVADRLRTRLARLTPALRAVRLRAGLGPAVGPDALGSGVRAARYARPTLDDRPVAVRTGSASAVALLAELPDEARRVFVDQVLGPLVAHDARTDADLLPTVTSFLDHDGSWRRTAEALHLHPNTVRYRIARAETLLGRDLGRTEHRADLHLALHLR